MNYSHPQAIVDAWLSNLGSLRTKKPRSLDLGPLPRGAETATACQRDSYRCWIGKFRGGQCGLVGRTRPRGSQPSRSATCTSQTRDEVPEGAFFLFVSKGFSEAIRLLETGVFRRNGSLNASRLFPSALHQNRDGFKSSFLFSDLARADYAVVEAVSTATDTNGGTRRRRGRARRSAFKRQFCQKGSGGR